MSDASKAAGIPEFSADEKSYHNNMYGVCTMRIIQYLYTRIYHNTRVGKYYLMPAIYFKPVLMVYWWP